jgi:hypothetical protein
VAAVFSVFRTLSPFVQFVGRIMRVIEQNNPQSVQNNGTVVFHAGANIARQWEDFQKFSQADQEYFDQLLPLEELSFGSSTELEIVPKIKPRVGNPINIVGQKNIHLQEIPLFEDEETRRAFELLVSRNISPDMYKSAFEAHEPIRVSKVRQRQADRKGLDELTRNKVGELLHSRGINPEGKNLDKKHLGKSNFVVVKSAFDQKIMALTGIKKGERSEMTQEQLTLAIDSLDVICKEVEREYIDA